MKCALLAVLVGLTFQSADLKWLEEAGRMTAQTFQETCAKLTAADLQAKLATEFPTSWPKEISRIDASTGLVRLAEMAGTPKQQCNAHLSLAVSLLGESQFDKALESADRALAIAEPLNDAFLFSDCELKRGAILIRLSKFNAAVAALERAEAGFTKIPSAKKQLALSWAYLGGAYARLDRPDDAVEALEKGGASEALSSNDRQICWRGIQAITNDVRIHGHAMQQASLLHEADGNWSLAARSWNNTAVFYNERYFEVWAALESARRCWKKLGNSEVEAAAWGINASGILLHIGKADEARTALLSSLKYYQAKSDVGAQASCMLNLSDVFLQLGSHANARQYVLTAAEKYRASGNLRNATLAEIIVAGLMVEDQNFKGAVQLASRTGATLPDDIDVQARSLAAQALALLLDNQAPRSIALAKKAAELFEQSDTPSGAVHSLQIKGRAELVTKNFEAAAATFEQGLKAVEAWREDLATPEFAAAAGVSLELLTGRGADALVRLNRQKEAFDFIQRSKAGTVYGSSDNPQALLRDGEAILDYAVSDDCVIIAVLRKSGLSVTRRPYTFEALCKDVKDFADAIQAGGVGRKALHDNLIKPIEGQLSGIKELIICPDDQLHSLPFGALGSTEPLITRFSITNALSAKAWANTVRRAVALSKDTQGPSLVVSKSDFKQSAAASAVRGGLHPLPNARAEAAVIKSTFGPKTQALAETAATPKAFLKLAPKAGVLHVATHALANRSDRSQTVLVLSPDSKGDSGYVYPTDLLKFKLQCRLAVLSACGTYAGKLVRGEGPQNFAWAFVVAGCPSVISTHWKIDDRAALAWAKAFYASYIKTRDPSDSLQKACLALRKSKDFSSPSHWAAWTLTGSNR